MVVVISSKDCIWSIHFQDLVTKITKRLTIISYFRFKLCLASLPSNNNLAPFDDRSHYLHAFKAWQHTHSPSRALRSSRRVDTVGSQFRTHRPSSPHKCSIGFKSGDKLGNGRLAMCCWFLYSSMMRAR